MRSFTVILFQGEPYLHYWCKHCTEECLNDLTADRTRRRECSDCAAIPVLEPKPPIDKILPSLRWAAVAAVTDFFEPPGGTAPGYLHDDYEQSSVRDDLKQKSYDAAAVGRDNEEVVAEWHPEKEVFEEYQARVGGGER